MIHLLSTDFWTYGASRSPRWRKVRAQHLKNNPRCIACGHKKNLEVHHIKPFHLFPELELEPSNLITLGAKCPSGNHHYLFGHCHDWHSYNPDVRETAAQMLLNIISRRP